MALADYFSRASVAAAHVLKGFDDGAFKSKLKTCAVAVAVDETVLRNHEAETAFDLAVDLLARLYPIIAFVALDDAATTKAAVERARAHVKHVNAKIDRDGKVGKASFLLAFGNTPIDFHGPRLYVGSDGWIAKLDVDMPVGSGSSDNPFGAAASACIAVANVFRAIFADQIADPRLDEHLRFDVLNLSHGSDAGTPLPEHVDIGEVHLAGVGAIGRATAWTLARVPGLAGDLHLVDSQTIDLSNLQRYLWTKERERGRVKTVTAAAMFSQANLKVCPHHMRWGAYLARRGDSRIDRVAVALDTKEDRMSVQACLPRRLLNAWTQPGDLGVSRHGFSDGPCAVCLYMPSGDAPSQSELVARAVGLPEPEVRGMLFAGTQVDRALAERIAEAADVDIEDIRPFIGEPLASFYVKAVCGTTVFGAPDGGDRGAFAVPMAFQSAMAGVLLASEIVADTLPFRRTSIDPTTTMDLLRPLGSILSQPRGKSETGRCICQDVDYQHAYRSKYPMGGSGETRPH